MLRLVLLADCLGAPAAADCRLALALAVDVSRSIDSQDYVIQTDGLAGALQDKDVRAAIFGAEGEVALAIYYWSGRGYQDLVQPWVILDSPEALDAAIWQVRRTPRPAAPLATALGDALNYGLDLMSDAPDCDRRVIDVAGDGRNNEGISVARTYERQDFTGITINGLAVGEHEADILDYYAREVIRGPGAFVEVAPRQSDYPQALRRKLLRELRGPMIGGLPLHLSQG
ncbi:MAG: DUF1194 domain-containing protein [Tabrizicola sp.]|uniref:DUF1194 domain-containing protein n=1 Tax=Tabrizicola sp. TaxID=2005166 RepID=UPI002ABAF501|nr:DUF1194 domain-containing protein [Tabrizicola sp.]MDZ4088384.1 DUF1194 domain-containing protein [Tabrizicola sp.]